MISLTTLKEAIWKLRVAGRLAALALGVLYLAAVPVNASDDGHDHEPGEACGQEAVLPEAGHESHEEDGHDEHGTDVHDDGPAEPGHDEHEADECDDDHSGPEDEGVIPVSAPGAKMVGIRTAVVGEATVGRSVVLPGEIGFNEDRRVHVTPRYGGIIREMGHPLGSRVSAGDVLAVVESNENLTAYEVRAPLSGRIVAREGAVGAYASEEVSLFVVADLSTVWVNFDVYPRHLSDVRRGASVTVHGVGVDQAATGTVSYVAPVFDRDRRVALARVHLNNPEGHWRPGMFVRAELHVAAAEPVAAVESDAVQTLDGETVVFVPAGDGAFRSVPVTVGAVGPTHTEIRSGLDLGDAYVADGAFELKAKIVTSALGGHAGHGH